LVEARLRHQREVLRQRNLDTDFSAFDRAFAQLPDSKTLAEVNGIEGQGARLYFAALAKALPEEFGFAGRQRRPPPDPFNAMLSLGYTLLYAQVETVLRASGLLPWLGFYHQQHGRHAALASDLMEPFRHLVERCALAGIARRQLTPADFFLDDTKGCRFTAAGIKRYLAMLSERFASPVTALDGQTAKILPEHLRDQNLALIAWIRGTVPEFVAWRMR
jgi:CRISP-associated protein Cas1